MTEVEKLIDATCPDCRGPMAQIRRGDLTEYRCLVGHVYTARAMLVSHRETQERSLWSAVVALEESVNLVRATSSEFPPEVAARLAEQAERKKAQASRIREIMRELEPFDLDR